MTVIKFNLKSLIYSKYTRVLLTLSGIVFILMVKQILENIEVSSQSNLRFKKSTKEESGSSSTNLNLKLNSDSTESTSMKILCYILLSRRKVQTAKLIKETWGSHCDDILFFGGYDYGSLPVIHLNTSEGYENLWGKAKAALIHLSQDSKYKKFQYFLKADDDTFVIVENLRKFIYQSALPLDTPHWFGFKLKHRKMPQGYMSGGAGYVFNYKALEKVSDVLTRVPPPFQGDKNNPFNTTDHLCNSNGEYGIEDLELGKCFFAAGVESIDTVDRNNSERFLPLSYDMFVNGAISSYHWIWRQAWNRVKTGKKCCSKDLISMHEVSPSQMKFIYHLLYKTSIWKGKEIILTNK